MSNDPVLIAYTVRDRTAECPAQWRRIGVAFPHDKGAGLTVLLDALPLDGRIVLVEPKADTARVASLRPAPKLPPAQPSGSSILDHSSRRT
jgi:hypothetical protein